MVCSYKFVVTATIGSMLKTQPTSLMIGSKCLWNGGTDVYSTITYVDEDETFYSVVVVFAVYLE